MNDGVVVLDHEFKHKLFNRRMEEISGFSRDTALGKTPWEAFPFLADTTVEKRIRDAFNGEMGESLEVRLTIDDNKTVWHRDSLSPLKDKYGTTVGVVGVIGDISRQKEADQELHRLRNYLSNIIDSMPSILVGVDNDLNVTLWNSRTQQITGITPDEATGRFLTDVLPELPEEIDRIRSAIQDQEVIRIPKVARKTEEETRFEDITIFPIAADAVAGAVIRVDDVTEQVRMQEMVIQGEKMLSVGGLAAGMAHEINNPLAGMMQTAQLMAQRLKAGANIPANLKAAASAGTTMEAIDQFMNDRGIQKMIEAIIGSGQRASEIVNNMLSFARKDDTTMTRQNLGELLDKTIELAATDYDLKKEYDFKRIEIIRDYDKNLSAVPCQSSKLQQVLLNILVNGAQAMQRAGVETPEFILRTGFDSARNMAIMEIEDNGPGMVENVRNHIFDPFFTTKPIGVGTGLGLSVSYFIITDTHQGNMDVESSPGAGARFIIRLPV